MKKYLVPAGCFFLGAISLALAQGSGIRPEIMVTLPWTWTGTQTFQPVFGAFVTESTTSRTIAAADCGKTITFTNGSSSTATFPSTIALGCSIAVVQGHTAGQVTITAGSSATVRNRSGFTKTAGVDSLVGVANSGATSSDWILAGDGA